MLRRTGSPPRHAVGAAARRAAGVSTADPDARALVTSEVIAEVEAAMRVVVTHAPPTIPVNGKAVVPASTNGWGANPANANGKGANAIGANANGSGAAATESPSDGAATALLDRPARALPDVAPIEAPMLEAGVLAPLLPAPEAPASGSEPEPPAAEPRRRAGRLRWVAVALAVLVAGVASVQLARPVPAPSLHLSLVRAMRVGGIAPVVPWPSTGEAAVAIPEAGVRLQSGPESAVPIASLAKLMTAYIVLRDHPLPVSAAGPTLTLSAADQTEATAEEAANATAVPVQAGEALTERQLLDGLLVHSANNFADVLARWDAGTPSAFVAKMNATAVALGMRSTLYADTSGLDNDTVGTAADQLRITAAAMAIPTFAAVVAQPVVTLPGAGALQNYVTSVGSDGVVGVKSGFTQAAMGCLVLAADRSVGGRAVLVLAAVTGQPAPDPLGRAQQADLALVDAAAAPLHRINAVAPGATLGRVTVSWPGGPVTLVAGRGVGVLVWPGETVRMSLSMHALRPGARPGAPVGALTVAIGGRRIGVPVRITGSLTQPSFIWRLAHG